MEYDIKDVALVIYGKDEYTILKLENLDMQTVTDDNILVGASVSDMKHRNHNGCTEESAKEMFDVFEAGYEQAKKDMRSKLEKAKKAIESFL